MKNTNNNPNAFQHKRQCKDNRFKTQKKKVFEAFKRTPSTMLMVSIETGIMRSNICRYVSKWKTQSSIKIVSLGICPISKRGGVQLLTTNPELFPKSNQIKLF